MTCIQDFLNIVNVEELKFSSSFFFYPGNVRYGEGEDIEALKTELTKWRIKAEEQGEEIERMKYRIKHLIRVLEEEEAKSTAH